MLSKQPESNVYKGWPMNKDEWFFYCARLQNDGQTQNTNTSLQKKKKKGKNNLLECMHVSIINIVGLLSKQKKPNNEK